MTIKNIEKLVAWYNENAKHECLDTKALLDDVVTQQGATGTDTYELSSFESKDGKPHTYSYEFSYSWDYETDTLENIVYEF